LRCIRFLGQLLVLGRIQYRLLTRPSIWNRFLQEGSVGADELLLILLPRARGVSLVVKRPDEREHHQERRDQQRQAERTRDYGVLLLGRNVRHPLSPSKGLRLEPLQRLKY